MPNTLCSAFGCTNRGGFEFPTDKKRRKEWIKAVNRRDWLPSKNSLLCRDHFTADDFISITKRRGTRPVRRRLKKTAVPSIFSWKKPALKCTPRRTRLLQRQTSVSHPTDERMDPDSEDPHSDAETINIFIDGSRTEYDHCDVGAEEETSTTHDNDHQDEEMDLDHVDTPPTINVCDASVQTDNDTTRAPLHSKRFVKDDEGMHYYTGLESYSKFLLVFESLGPAAHDLAYFYGSMKSSVIAVQEQFFLTLVKLRRHTTNFELSRSFNISEADVYNIFYTFIVFMHLQWSELNIWPEKELVNFFMPSDFKAKFPSTRVIVDGTEIPIRKPSLPAAQQQTFSTYKNRNTMKVLIGCSPGGLISFISNAYGGSTSDRQIVERSKLMGACDPKDSVMADKGFDVQDIFAPYDVSINIPTFFKKNNRLNASTVIKDRRIASKRVHIERIIGLAKTYKILTEPLKQTESKLATQIIFVVFMLCNFRKCIVPKTA